jgi:hypothetical protein
MWDGRSELLQAVLRGNGIFSEAITKGVIISSYFQVPYYVDILAKFVAI